MAEERYNYNISEAIDALLKEADSMNYVNEEIVSDLKNLARECRAMRAAAEEYAASGSSSSESSNSELTFGKGFGMSKSTDDSDESAVWNAKNSLEHTEFLLRHTIRRDEAYKRAVEHLVIRLRNWRMELEDAKYEAIDFDLPLTVWTKNDRKIMKAEIVAMSYEVRKNKIVERMVELNKYRVSKVITEESKLAVEMLELLLQDIFLLRVTPFKDLVFPLSMDNIYDYERISNALKNRHSAAECQEFWYSRFHPDINSRSWSKAENRSLAALADAYNLHHWDEIALQMNTNRSGFQCYVQYRRFLYKDKPVVLKLSQMKDENDCKNNA